MPNVPVYNANLNFSLDRFDSGIGIQWANLFVDNGSGFQKYAMTLQDADNQIYTYLLTNASYQYNSTLKYYSVFADNINNTNTDPAGAPTNFLIVRITDKTFPFCYPFPMQLESERLDMLHLLMYLQQLPASGVSSCIVIILLMEHPFGIILH